MAQETSASCSVNLEFLKLGRHSQLLADKVNRYSKHTAKVVQAMLATCRRPSLLSDSRGCGTFTDGRGPSPLKTWLGRLAPPPVYLLLLHNWSAE